MGRSLKTDKHKTFIHILAATAAVIALNLAAGLAEAQPAPPLRYLQVYAVGSSTQGWQYVPPEQQITPQDHGGAQLRVATVEIGYGASPLAMINGLRLPNSANYRTDRFCNYSDPTIPCRPGETIVGWLRYWRLDGYQGGRFYYQNTSTNYPRNTLADAVTIR